MLKYVACEPNLGHAIQIVGQKQQVGDCRVLECSGRGHTQFACVDGVISVVSAVHVDRSRDVAHMYRRTNASMPRTGLSAG